MNIFSFIKSLSPDEREVVSSVFKQRKNNVKSSNESEFFHLVLSTPLKELTDEFVLNHLEENISYDAYCKLKSRIFLKILDKMCSEDFLFNDEIIEGTDRAEVRVKKKLLQVKILKVKTASSDREAFNHLLSQIIDEAKEYELYDSLVEALTYKAYNVGARSGYGEYLKLKQEVSYYSALAIAKREAITSYNEVISNQELISHFSEEEMKEFLDEKIRALENCPYTTVSVRIMWFYKTLLLAQYEREKKNSESIKTCQALIKLCERNKVLGTTEKFGFTYGNFSQCLTLQRQFKEAARMARASQNYFPHISLNYVLMKEQEFFACFYAKEYYRCREILDVMLNHDKRDTGQIRSDKFTYYKGCLDFVERKFKEAKLTSNIALEIIKDKKGWDLGIRYLKIMSLVELGDFEDARQALEALRKQRSGSKDKGMKKPDDRDDFIYKALNEYGNCGFQKATSERLIYFLRQLADKDSEKSWQFFNHEIIPVHSWIKKRMRRTLRKVLVKNSAIKSDRKRK